MRYVGALRPDLVILLRTVTTGYEHLGVRSGPEGMAVVSQQPTRTDAGLVAPAGDAAFARWLAARAGAGLRALRDELGFGDPAALRAAGDRRSHELLVSELARWRPGDAVLSEEGERTDHGRLSADRVWIVDPLDGTREFAEEGRSDWAVHVALWQRYRDQPRAERSQPDRTDLDPPGFSADGGRLVAGAVALPAQAGGAVLGTDTPPAYPPMHGGRLRLAASRSRPPGFLADLCDRVDGEVVPMGSAGAKMAAVVQGTVDAYVHAGGQYEWDSAAPVAVALAAGLHASRVDGSALAYNRPDPWLPDVLVCRRDLAPRLLEVLGELGVGREVDPM
jgi:3'(2'), 5'-bisphosphate nucleotidase